MKKLVLALLLVNLTGCAQYAQFANAQDPCQRVGKAEDYVKPKWCHMSQGSTYFVQQPLGRTGPIVITRN